jgi:hypothetical protein
MDHDAFGDCSAMWMVSTWRLVCFVIACFLFARDVDGQCNPQCSELTSCTSCIIGDDPKKYFLQILQKPEFILPQRLRILNSYELEYPCNRSCQWDTRRKSCSDMPLSAAIDNPDFVYPYWPEDLESMRFDLYLRMANSVYCESSTGTSHNNLQTINCVCLVRDTVVRCLVISSRASTHRCHTFSAICALPERFVSLLRSLPKIHTVLCHPCNLHCHVTSNAFLSALDPRMYFLQDRIHPNRSRFG